MGILFFTTQGKAQVVFYTESFEGAVNSGYTSSGVFSDGSNDYFDLIGNGTDPTGHVVFGGIDGTQYWVGEDTDDAGNPNGTGVGVGFSDVTISGINVTGYTSLQVRGAFASLTAANYDPNDHILIYANIDGGGEVLVGAFESESAGTNNFRIAEDTNLDGVGDGTQLNTTLNDFTFNIAATGASLDIRIEVYGQFGGSDLGFDNIRILGVSSCTAPTGQATFTSFTSVNSTDFTINFAAGTGGNGRIVVVGTAAIASSPSSGTTYTANTVFGSGTDISGGSGEYVVYDNTGTSVTVTGLTMNTTYYVAIFEYATGGATDPCYDGSLSGNIGNATTICGTSSEPTTASSAISFSNAACTSMDIGWTSGNGTNVIVIASTNPITGNPSDQTAYTSSATFGAGDILNAGEFVIYNGNATTVSLSSLLPGTTYYFEIFDYNATGSCDQNYLTSSSPTDNEPTIVCVDPELTAILVDACGGAVEGINEFFTFSNGNTDFGIDSLSVDYPFNGPYCNTTCTSGFVTNPTFVASLNTTAGCAGLFVEADPIPAGAKAIVFTGASPTYAFDFAGLCGTGPYYAIFTDNASTGGRFANYNATCAGRTLTVDFGPSYTDVVTYDRCLLSNTDGDYVSFAADGTPTYSNDGCTPTATLPIELLNFSGYGNNSTNFLEWSTSTEINNDYFDVERSKDGSQFDVIGMVYGNGTTTIQQDYSFVDESSNKNLNYYRLKQFDFNGNYSYSNTIAIKSGLEEFSIWHANNLLHISSSNKNKEISQINIYNTLGQLVYSSNEKNNSLIKTNGFQQGIYLVHVKTENSTIIKKVKF